jgi:hypothetical protein
MQGFVEAGDSGVVYQNIDAAERAIDASSGVFELMQERDVAGDDFGFAAGVEDGAGGGVEGGLGASAEDGGGAEMGEHAGDGCADAAAGSGDDGDLAV